MLRGFLFLQQPFLTINIASIQYTSRRGFISFTTRVITLQISPNSSTNLNTSRTPRHPQLHTNSPPHHKKNCIIHTYAETPPLKLRHYYKCTTTYLIPAGSPTINRSLTTSTAQSAITTYAHSSPSSTAPNVASPSHSPYNINTYSSHHHTTSAPSGVPSPFSSPPSSSSSSSKQPATSSRSPSRPSSPPTASARIG